MPFMAQRRSSTSPDTAERPAHRAIVWLEPEQADLARIVGSLSGVSFVAAGCPQGSGAGRGRSAEVAQALGAEPIDDLLRTLANAEADVALFLAAGRAPEDPSLSDPTLLRSCLDRNLKIATLEPAPTTVSDRARLEKALGAGSMEKIRFVPAMRRSRGFRAGAEIIESIAPLRTLAVGARGGAGQGSLAARLFDAMDVVLGLMGEPETIDCAIAGPATPSGVHMTPGESLRDLRGDLSANLRFASGKSASLMLSDSAGRWFRGVTVLAHGGCLRIDDKSFELIDPAGATVDRTRSRLSSGGADDPPAAAAIAEQLGALLDPRTPAPTPINAPVALAMCEAALLSARTGQGESPATILRMAGAP